MSALYIYVIKVKVCSVIFIQVLYVLCLYKAQISGERFQDHWSSGLLLRGVTGDCQRMLLFYDMNYNFITTGT